MNDKDSSDLLIELLDAAKEYNHQFEAWSSLVDQEQTRLDYATAAEDLLGAALRWAQSVGNGHEAQARRA